MVEFLVYEGEQIPCRVSYYALQMMQKDLNRGIAIPKEGDLNIDYEAYETLLYYSLQLGHRKHFGKEKPFPFTKEDMIFVMDEVFTSFMSALPRFFSDLGLETVSEEIKITGEEITTEKKQKSSPKLSKS